MFFVAAYQAGNYYMFPCILRRIEEDVFKHVQGLIGFSGWATRCLTVCALGAAFVPVICAQETARLDGLPKPRVIVTTDGEQDDLQSFTRYLFHSNEFDTEGLIYGNSVWHWAPHENDPGRNWNDTDTQHGKIIPDWMEVYIADYAKVEGNLRLHHPDYPTLSRVAQCYSYG